MTITITVQATELHVHAAPETDLTDVIAQLGRIEQLATSLLTGQGDAKSLLLTSFQEHDAHMDAALTQLLDKLDAETTAVANRIQAQIDQISTDTSAADLTTIKARISADVDHLTTLAADPANPVPVAPATDPATGEVVVP